MSIEHAILARAKPQLIGARLRLSLSDEICKGCQSHIAPFPVNLEPPYRPIISLASAAADAPIAWIPTAADNAADLVRLQVWVPPDQECDWHRSELFLKHLSGIGQRVGLEIAGNQKQIVMQLLADRTTVDLLRAAFAGQFEAGRLVEVREHPLELLPPDAWATAAFLDYYPPAPYSHSLTDPNELRRSPYAVLLTSLAQIPPPAMGFYQVLFAPVAPDHDWHQNIQVLLDQEFSLKLLAGFATPFRAPQQAPSGDLRHMAEVTQAKAHADKPLYAAAFRIGVLQEQGRPEQALRSLGLIAHLFQHGGRPLHVVTADEYRRCLSSEDIRSAILHGLVHRPGFLVNSWELASLVHIPPPTLVESLHVPVPSLDSLAPDPSLAEGTPIGRCLYAGTEHPVCIPSQLRFQHVHVIGRPKVGKSTLLMPMILDDIARGHGVALLDPHGHLVEDLLRRVPKEHLNQVIYFDPGDPDWIPIWNPLQPGMDPDPGRTADDFVGALKDIVSGYGDRLEHLLRNSIFALLHLPHTSLLDVSDLLRHPKAPERERLLCLIKKAVDNEAAKSFWRNDFPKYRHPDLSPVQHKLSKLLTSRTVSLMLSQTDSSFHFRDIMDSGKILLVNLSTIGTESREVLGSLILSLLHRATLGRSSMPPSTYRPFHIYCDEAHRFLTDTLEDMLVEMRKFKVSLTLAHQHMKQFDAKKAGAISGVDTVIVFRVSQDDAEHMARGFQQMVEPEEFMALEDWHAIARIGKHILRIETYPPPAMPEPNYRQEIIAQSRARYYRPAEVVRRQVRDRHLRWQEPLTDHRRPATTRPGAPTRQAKMTVLHPPAADEDLSYDEL